VDAAHRVHARVEDFIPTGKDTGLGHLPSKDMQVNAAWMTASMIACTLLARLRLLALDGDLAKAEPKTLRYRVLHAAARLVRGGRRQTLQIAAPWPPAPLPQGARGVVLATATCIRGGGFGGWGPRLTNASSRVPRRHAVAQLQRTLSPMPVP